MLQGTVPKTSQTGFGWQTRHGSSTKGQGMNGDHTRLTPMVTHWMPRTDTMETQYGRLSNLEWCHKDAARMNAGGGLHCYVVEHIATKACAITKANPVSIEASGCRIL